MAGAAGEDVDVKAASTGNHSELVSKIEIKGKPKGWTRVMELKKSRVPSFIEGDKLRVSAELGVTTDCTHSASRCTGKPYTYDPRVDTKVVLASGGRDVTLASDTSRCQQKPNDRQHHCIIPFHGLNATGAAQQLNCAGGGCRVEVLARSYNSKAGSGDVLIIGGQQEDGTLSGDKGRINAIRLRGEPEAKSRHAKLQDKSVPPDLKRRVIISLRLNRLEEGDVIEGWADIHAEVSHLSYAALVGSEIVLAEKPNKIHGGKFVKRITNLGGELTETAGTNCTQSQTPCPVFRTGVLTMHGDSAQGGNPVPLFLNLVVRTNNKQQSSDPGDQIRFKDDRGLNATVYERD